MRIRKGKEDNLYWIGIQILSEGLKITPPPGTELRRDPYTRQWAFLPVLGVSPVEKKKV